MLTAAHYRREVERYRELAAAEPDPERAKQLLGFAQDFEVLAALLEEDERAGEQSPPKPTQ